MKIIIAGLLLAAGFAEGAKSKSVNVIHSHPAAKKVAKPAEPDADTPDYDDPEVWKKEVQKAWANEQSLLRQLQLKESAEVRAVNDNERTSADAKRAAITKIRTRYEKEISAMRLRVRQVLREKREGQKNRVPL